MTQGGGSRPDSNETPAERERYEEARLDFGIHSERIETATNRFRYSVSEFHALEAEFLALVEELRRTATSQMANLAHLEGLRMRLLTSYDESYRHAVNELADSLIASIGLDQAAKD